MCMISDTSSGMLNPVRFSSTFVVFLLQIQAVDVGVCVTLATSKFGWHFFGGIFSE